MSDLDERVLDYIGRHVGSDDEDVAEALDLPLFDVVESVDRLLAAGRLDFAR